MYRMTTEYYERTGNGGFRRKPYEVTEEVVTDEFFENYTDPAQTRFFNSFSEFGGYERRYPNGYYGCKIVTVPPGRDYRRVVRFKYTPRA